MLEGFRCRPSHGNLAALVEEQNQSPGSALRSLERIRPRTHQRGGVRGDVVVEASHESGQTKVRDFADQVGVDQHVPGRQVPVDEVPLSEVPHPCPDASEHPDQLQDAELTLVLLGGDQKVV